MAHHHQSDKEKTVYKAAILIVSTKGACGQRKDLTGPKLAELVKEQNFKLLEIKIIADDQDEIIGQLVKWIDDDKIDLVLTSGGTGLSPSDLTPEATQKVLHREIIGLAELMRLESLKKTPMAALSRAICGQRRESLIINLPGSPKGALENFLSVAPTLKHALDKIKGDPSDCAEIAVNLKNA